MSFFRSAYDGVAGFVGTVYAIGGLIIARMVPLYRHSRINSRDNDDDAFDGLIVGMALSPSYGTVSVRRSDGSYAAAAKVDGSESYLETMTRLSDPNACHPT